MTEDRGYSAVTGALIFGAGILLGGAIVYVMFKGIKEHSLSQPVTSRYIPHEVEEYSQLSQQQLSQQQLSQQQLSQQQLSQQQLSQQPNDIVHMDQETTYKNNEKWQIERGPDGRIKSLNVIRDAKVN